MKKSIYQWLTRTVLALVCLLTTTSAWAETWTVAGEPAALFGTTWAPSNTANDMTNVGGTKYIFFKKNVTVTGTASFKVCKDHAWTTAYPSDNYNLNCSSGTYDFLITFDSNTKTVKGVYSFTVAGNNATLFGTTWDPSNNSNNMTTTNGEIYTWSKENVVLTAGDIEFKVCGNHRWDIAYPTNNKKYNISKAGTYNVTVTYNSFTDDVNIVAEEVITSVDAPTFSPAAGTYNSDQNVTLSCATNGATIYYTTNGSDPTTSSTVYNGAIALNGEGTTTIKAIAVKDGNSSAVAEATYTIAYDRYYVRGNNTDFFGNDSWNTNANVMTTTDDTNYTWTSGQATLAAGATVEFKVVKNGSQWIGTAGDDNGNNIVCTATQAGVYTLTVNYTVHGVPVGTLNLVSGAPEAPTFTPAAGTYNSNQSVTIACATSGATIYYTTDGNTPTTSSAVYSGAIALNGEGTTTIKAIAVNNGITSAVAEATYTIAYDRYYAVGDNESIFGTTWDATNNQMTSSDDVHFTWTSGQVTLNAGTTVGFKVVKNGNVWIPDGMDNEIKRTAEQNGVYTLTVTYTVGDGEPSGALNLIGVIPDAPTFTPAGGTYNSNQSVTIACATSGATIYYTTDGSDPTTSSTVYSGAIALNSEAITTIKAIAVVDGRSSTVAEATYTIAYDRYYVVGEPNDVFPSGWTIGDAQLMIANGTTWTWTKSPITLAEDATIAFKVKKKSGNDETWIPSGANITVGPEYGAGNYALTITYVEGEETPNGTLTPLFVTTPVFSPAPGTYDTNQNVTITAGNGTIYYTTDGTDPETSETRIAYNGPISVAGEGEHVIKAVSIVDGNASDVVTAEYVIKYQNIYLFGSVGKAHAWVYNYNNPELVTSDGVNYSGVANVNVMTDYHRSDGTAVGLFLLTTGFGSNWETTEPMMIGTTATDENNHYWIDGGTAPDYNFGQWLDTRAGSENVGQSNLHTNGWCLPEGTYEFFYKSDTKQLMVSAFDGPTIYVYDYTRPYIYVEDKDGNPFDGVQPGNPIQILDETVGGHSGLSTAGNGTGDGIGTLGWYKFAVPVHPASCPVKFQFHHNGDKRVIDSDFYTTSGDAYYYWDGEAYQPLASRADADNLRRIVAHVRVQGTEVPTCDGVPMNGPSSFYGQMYYWMAVTTYNKGENVVISDGTHHYEGTLYSDIYLEWTDENSSNYELISEETLEHRLANKTGRGTIIHLQKNRNTPPTKDNYVIGVDTKVQDADVWTNTTNLGTTWWGTSLDSPWKGSVAWTDGILANYDNSRFLYMENGITRGPDVYIVTAEDGTEWYTWYCDRSTATIRFGYGEALNGYPTYVNDKDVYKFFAHYESAELHQNAGELWYVWTPDFDATLDNNNQSRDNGDILDVTRTYESSAKQKALCSTFRDGNYVYYTDIKGWGDDNVYCYVWSVPGLEWPGVQMVKVGYDDEGHPVYLADLSNFDVSNAEGILFNNGVTDSHATNKRQTGNLEWQNHGCYDYLGLLYRIGGNVDVIENEPDGFPTSVTLTGVWYSRVKGTLLAKGNNDYNNKSVNGMGYKDFAKTVTDGSENGSVLQSRDYDQSNWVEIYPSEDGLVDAQALIDLIGKPFTLYGTKTSSVNPTFTAISISNVGAVGDKYNPNHFTPIHMNGSCYQYRRGEQEWYFFVEPKPNEFAVIDWAAYHEATDGHDYFYTPSNTGFDGEFVVDWSYFDKFNQDGEATTALEPYQMEVCGQNPGNLQVDESYKGWFAIIKVNQSSAPAGDDASQTKSSDAKSTGKYTVCPVYINDENIMTAIEDINFDKPSGDRTLKATRYYNMMGVESRTPFQGVNIVVKEYTDGTRESKKVIMR